MISKDKISEKPKWLKSRLGDGVLLHEIKRDLRSKALHTVCESAKCPNIGECFSKKRATFLIMGNICTRNCTFCAVKSGQPTDLDAGEPEKISQMAESMNLGHVVVTSVTRDDLPDGGAGHFAATIEAIRRASSKRTIEVLTPDFAGSVESLRLVLDAKPDIFNHNLETTQHLTNNVRSGATYGRSLGILRSARAYATNIIVKSGIMVGLGETDKEIYKTLDDLAMVGCNIVTIGQYLRPSMNHAEVKRCVKPEIFEGYKRYGESIGIGHVFSGPLVRSSYMAENVFNSLLIDGRDHG